MCFVAACPVASADLLALSEVQSCDRPQSPTPTIRSDVCQLFSSIRFPRLSFPPLHSIQPVAVATDPQIIRSLTPRDAGVCGEEAGSFFLRLQQRIRLP